jgi:2-succinyl-6-hydroxy-2,4-cyclohexadiene-1-carboxylate synthase
MERFHVDVGGGVRLHATREGKGPPLVLLHGFTGSTESWTPVRRTLVQRFTTIAVDLPGHGRSTSPADPARYALPGFVQDLARVLDALGLERTSLLGYSLGGRAALRFALERPDRVGALVIESASPGIAKPAERAARLVADGALAEEIERDGITAFVDKWERLPLWASQAALSPEARSRLRAQRLGNDRRGLANSLRGAGAGLDLPLLERLGALHVPTLLVAGALDGKYTELARQMAGAIPGAQLAIVPEAGHAVHLERPEEFAAVVLRFLDAVR